MPTKKVPISASSRNSPPTLPSIYEYSTTTGRGPSGPGYMPIKSRASPFCWVGSGPSSPTTWAGQDSAVRVGHAPSPARGAVSGRLSGCGQDQLGARDCAGVASGRNFHRRPRTRACTRLYWLGRHQLRHPRQTPAGGARLERPSLDEAHYLKNYRSQRHRLALDLVKAVGDEAVVHLLTARRWQAGRAISSPCCS